MRMRNSDKAKVLGLGVIALVLAAAVAAFAFGGFGMAGVGHGAGIEDPPPADDSGDLAVRVEHPGYHEGEGGGTHDTDWEKVRGTVRVDLTTQGPIRSVEFYLGNRLIHTEDDGSFEWDFDTTQYRDCMYWFTAKAYGPNGTEAQDSTRIWIDNTDGNCM